MFQYRRKVKCMLDTVIVTPYHYDSIKFIPVSAENIYDLPSSSMHRNNTSFGKERVFDVVDKRLLTGKPMIVTTNIPLSVMKQAADLDDRRIFDRILEVCVPIMFDGDSFRKSTAADNLKTAARLLG